MIKAKKKSIRLFIEQKKSSPPVFFQHTKPIISIFSIFPIKNTHILFLNCKFQMNRVRDNENRRYFTKAKVKKKK